MPLLRHEHNIRGKPQCYVFSEVVILLYHSGCYLYSIRSIQCCRCDLSPGLRMPLPMIKWSFSRLDVGRSSSMLFPCTVYSPSFRRLVTYQKCKDTLHASLLLYMLLCSYNMKESKEGMQCRMWTSESLKTYESVFFRKQRKSFKKFHKERWKKSLCASYWLSGVMSMLSMLSLTSSVIFDFFLRVRDTSLWRTLFFLWLSTWAFCRKKDTDRKELINHEAFRP